MTPDSHFDFQPAPQSCDAIQMELSDFADQSPAPALPPEIREHLAHCAHCAHFARLWLNRAAAPIAALQVGPAPVSPTLRDNILSRAGEASATNVVPASQFRAWRGLGREMLAKAAALVALAAFSYWLLQPHYVEPPPKTSAAALAPRALAQSIAAAEAPMARERDALRLDAMHGRDQLRQAIRSSFFLVE